MIYGAIITLLRKYKHHKILKFKRKYPFINFLRIYSTMFPLIEWKA